MREPKYLSPTSVGLFYSDRSEFYTQYLADNRPPRRPQTQPMSIGSAFDAYAKAYLHDRIIGDDDPDFYFEKMFEDQVEPHNRDWAREHGKYVFESYRTSGALGDLMLELRTAVGTPRFEFTVEGKVSHEACIEGIPLLGKPDIYNQNEAGGHVIRDWKVNGYCSKGNTSPKPGYVMIRDGWKASVSPASRGTNSEHKDCDLFMSKGVTLNIGTTLEQIDLQWAGQLAIYAWLLGEPVGGKFIVGIEQLVCKSNTNGKYPLIRVATHRLRIDPQWQKDWFAAIAECWRIIQSGHVFDDLSRDESDERCKVLDDQYKAYEGGSDADKWYRETMRKHQY